jgi:O-antigen ligase
MVTGRANLFPEIRLVALASGCAWAIGTNWLGDWYYPIRGISWGDLLFVGWLLIALSDRKRRDELLRTLWTLRIHVLLLTIFVTLLLVSMAVNAYRFGAQENNVLAILRLLYFIAIVWFVCQVVQLHGYLSVLCGFLTGVLLLALGELYYARASGAVVVAGIIVLRDPNVIGNMLGVAVLLCSLGVLAGYVRASLIAAIVFAAISLMTFSKGTWLMVLVGLAANAIAWFILFRRTKGNFNKIIPATAAIVLAFGWLVYENAELLSELVNTKIESTYDVGSAEFRYRFALAALHAMEDHPIWGLGFGNYPQVERLYPSIMPEPSENAHNAFFQIAAVGGLPALVVLLSLFVYPFIPLWHVVRARSTRSLTIIYISLAFLVFALSGSVQLQLIAQPFFWVFTGIACGWRARLQPPTVGIQSVRLPGLVPQLRQ